MSPHLLSGGWGRRDMLAVGEYMIRVQGWPGGFDGIRVGG